MRFAGLLASIVRLDSAFGSRHGLPTRKAIEYLERLKKITEAEMSGFVKGLSMPEEFQPKPKIVLPPYDPTRREFRILRSRRRSATAFGKLLDSLPILRGAGPRPK